MKKYILALITLLAIAPTAVADDANDIAEIKQTAMDYMEAWYQGDAEKMEESLHKELAKRSLKPGPGGDQKELRLTSAPDMISYTKSGYGTCIRTKDLNIEVVVLDHFKNIAAVKVITEHYYEYLHLAKPGKKWLIVNGLYEKNGPTH